jgi:hypothetical protein
MTHTRQQPLCDERDLPRQFRCGDEKKCRKTNSKRLCVTTLPTPYILTLHTTLLCTARRTKEYSVLTTTHDTKQSTQYTKCSPHYTLHYTIHNTQYKEHSTRYTPAKHTWMNVVQRLSWFECDDSRWRLEMLHAAASALGGWVVVGVCVLVCVYVCVCCCVRLGT